MLTLNTFLRAKEYLSIRLSLTKTNHFELTAKINGTKGRFILDTGASNTCVGMDKAIFFGLTVETTEIKAAGAGAIDMETKVSTNNTITIGKWTKRRQQLVLFDLSHVNQALINHEAEQVDGIIGADILKKGKAVIDYNRKRLYLKK